MKKLFLLTLTAAISVSSFAQSRVAPTATKNKSVMTEKISVSNAGKLLQKTTNNFDTLSLNYIGSDDTLAVYGESGYGAYYGLNRSGFTGYAERYDVANADTTIKILGVVARFGGVYNTASTKTVTFKVWDQSAAVPVTPTVSLVGFPNNQLAASAAIPVTNLGMGNGSAPDTAKAYALTTATNYLTSAFFVGYEVSYDTLHISGDTLGLYSNLDGERHTSLGYVSNGDTTYITQNVIKALDGQWYDNYLEVYNIFNHLDIYPIAVIQTPTSVSNITKGGLTFFGNFPNPAVNSTNVKFSLKNTTDVTVQIMDMNGRVLNTINQSKLSAGEHTIAVETSALASGTYLYVIRTAEGDGMASQLTIVK
jgi:hypothetical protein